MTDWVKVLAVAVVADVTEEHRVEELRGLLENRGLHVSMAIRLPAPRKPTASLYFSQTTLEMIKSAATEVDAAEIVFHADISVRHQRNLTEYFGITIRDRTDIILGIFAQRARSRQGRLQVALATARYRASRLVRGWTHLERQRGGTGAMGGPGEAQLELDRRQLLDQCKRLEHRVAEIGKRRSMQRRARQKNHFPQVALVGYTNAGKTSLFNLLTGDEQEVANKLFATLDPVARRFSFYDQESTTSVPGILVDSVGFIRDLPTHLKDAFQATFEEISACDLLVHVVDGSDPMYQDKYRTVEKFIDSIMLSQNMSRIVFINKIDACDASVTLLSESLSGSVKNNLGINELRQEIIKRIRQDYLTYSLPADDVPQQAVAWLAKWGALGSFLSNDVEEYWQVTLNREMLGRLQKTYPHVAESLRVNNQDQSFTFKLVENETI